MSTQTGYLKKPKKKLLFNCGFESFLIQITPVFTMLLIIDEEYPKIKSKFYFLHRSVNQSVLLKFALVNLEQFGQLIIEA